MAPPSSKLSPNSSPRTKQTHGNSKEERKREGRRKRRREGEEGLIKPNPNPQA
jgi:hypothetical protein